jgi:hypothetical protein
MTNTKADTSQHKAAKAAGFIFLFIVTGWILNWTFIDSKLHVTGNVLTTVNNIMANELLFRIGIINELIFSVSGMFLAAALYIILKPVNRNLALLAFCLKMVETVIAAVIVLAAFIALQMLNGKALLTAMKPEQFMDIAGLFFNVRSTGSTISMVFLGLNFTLFFYLLLKSRYVPGILAGFGIISYSLILIYSLSNILLPSNTAVNSVSMIFYTPSILFEILIGLWLIFKGLKIPGVKS